jgi:hypothetical protein
MLSYLKLLGQLPVENIYTDKEIAISYKQSATRKEPMQMTHYELKRFPVNFYWGTRIMCSITCILK